jgi:pimeloyl-ACP methyl ester carboxylesterase
VRRALNHAVNKDLVVKLAYQGLGTPASGPLPPSMWSYNPHIRRYAYDPALKRMVFVGTAASRWQVADVPENTLVIHGETDDTVPIASVYDWARPQELPVVVIPGAEHFLHRKLHVLKRIIVDAWR